MFTPVEKRFWQTSQTYRFLLLLAAPPLLTLPPAPVPGPLPGPGPVSSIAPGLAADSKRAAAAADPGDSPGGLERLAGLFFEAGPPPLPLPLDEGDGGIRSGGTGPGPMVPSGMTQVWSLTQFYSVDF